MATQIDRKQIVNLLLVFLHDLTFLIGFTELLKIMLKDDNDELKITKDNNDEQTNKIHM